MESSCLCGHNSCYLLIRTKKDVEFDGVCFKFLKMKITYGKHCSDDNCRKQGNGWSFTSSKEYPSRLNRNNCTEGFLGKTIVT